MKYLAICALTVFLVACSLDPAEIDPFAATDANDAHSLRSYLDNGGNVNVKSSRGESLLYIATGPHGGEDVLRLLLERGANPNEGVGAYSPLMNASSWCWLKGVTLLVEAGADMKARNEIGETALQTVCSAGRAHDEVVAYLKERGL